MEGMVKKVLVTGATGFIGSNLVRKLYDKGYEVYVLLRPNSTLGTKRLEDYKKIYKIYGNSKELVYKANELPQFDVCYNLASYGVDYRQQDIDLIIEGNIKFTLDIIDFCSKNNTKLLIHTGSCFEYGINENEFLTEEHNINPQSLYGSAKAASVIMANTYAKLKNVKMITVRPFGIYGINEGIHKLIPSLIKAAINKENIKLTEGYQIRDYLYIEDLLEAYMILSDNDNIDPYEIFNVCSSKKTSIRDIVKHICEISGTDMSLFKFGEIPYRKNEVMSFVGDNTKIVREINWKPKYSLREGLELTYKWYKENLEVI